ncbi:MAG TPA: right-handed parallel beta-helix repeat-containing protein [Flavisolibacter sp.]|nr:right-handed parallel beta-helix repeat-containing protein [Flavisolibacter sp.]
MKQFLILLSLICAMFSVSGQNKGKRIYLTKNNDNGSLFTQGSTYEPGDTIVVRASLNPWSYIYVGGIKGTKKQPVVFINEGIVEFVSGIDVDNCQYLKISGSGAKERYGFRIKGSGGAAISVRGKSAHVEVERFHASDGSFGCWIKNEASCDTSVNNWVLDDITVHDYEIHNMKIEGFYAGSTDPNNASRPVNCNGTQQYYKPSKLGNIRIYNGVIDGTGRPAIQVSNAQVGMSEIYNNVISNVGREFNDQQGTGISLGGYTRAFVHHNKIRNTYTWGIACIGGSGLIRIENNVIDSSGYLDGRHLNWPQNIMMDTRPTIPPDTTRFIIRNNIVSNPGKDVHNIEIWKSLPTYGRDNIICNNKAKGKAATVGVAPGIQWYNCRVLQKSSATGFNLSKRKMAVLAVGGFLFLIMVFVALYKWRRRSPKKINQERASVVAR